MAKTEIVFAQFIKEKTIYQCRFPHPSLKSSRMQILENQDPVLILQRDEYFYNPN